MTQTAKRFEVRFQQVQAFAITINAANAHEADQVALNLFKANPDAAKLLRTDHGFFTIEDLTAKTAEIQGD